MASSARTYTRYFSRMEGKMVSSARTPPPAPASSGNNLLLVFFQARIVEGNIKLQREEHGESGSSFQHLQREAQGWVTNCREACEKGQEIIKLNGQYLSAELSRELETLQKIKHQNLVRFLGFFEHRDETLIVVEYVDNGSLREHLDGGGIDGLARDHQVQRSCLCSTTHAGDNRRSL